MVVPKERKCGAETLYLQTSKALNAAPRDDRHGCRVSWVLPRDSDLTQELLPAKVHQETVIPGTACSQPWVPAYPQPHGKSLQHDCKTVQVEHLDLQQN